MIDVAIVDDHEMFREGLVLVLNRLMAPRPLYKIADWMATMVISAYLGK